MNIKIDVKKLSKVGNSYYIRIPMSYIKSGLVDPVKKHNVLIKQSS